MTAIREKLDGIIEPAVAALGYELVGYELLQSGNSTTLRVYVDDKDGIGIDAIEKVSRQISAVMDVEEPIVSHYTLEVSSPGLDRPLFKLADYQRFIGKQIKLRLRLARGGQRNFVGEIVSVQDQEIGLALESGDQVVINFDEIDKANLIPEF